MHVRVTWREAGEPSMRVTLDDHLDLLETIVLQVGPAALGSYASYRYPPHPTTHPYPHNDFKPKATPSPNPAPSLGGQFWLPMSWNKIFALVTAPSSPDGGGALVVLYDSTASTRRVAAACWWLVSLQIFFVLKWWTLVMAARHGDVSTRRLAFLWCVTPVTDVTPPERRPRRPSRLCTRLAAASPAPPSRRNSCAGVI